MVKASADWEPLSAVFHNIAPMLKVSVAGIMKRKMATRLELLTICNLSPPKRPRLLLPGVTAAFQLKRCHNARFANGERPAAVIA